MIRAADKKIITAVLGAQYSKKVIAYLSKKNITNRYGDSFISESITKIVNGKRTNEVVETAIAELVAKEKKRKIKVEKKIKEKIRN